MLFVTNDTLETWARCSGAAFFPSAIRAKSETSSQPLRKSPGDLDAQVFGMVTLYGRYRMCEREAALWR